MRALVTGGAGFIGSHLVDALLARGDEVVVLDDFSTGRRENLAGVLDRIELIEGTILSSADVARALDGVECVLHQAARPSVARSVTAPIESHMVNTTGMLHLLEGMVAAGTQRIVYASSSSVYGGRHPTVSADSPGIPEAYPPRPLSPYAVQKLMCEEYACVYRRLYGLETIGLRYFNVFGPRQNPDGEYAAVIPRFIRAMLRGMAPTVHGDGTQTRDFTYVQNVVAANLAAMRAPLSPWDAPQVYNVACGSTTSIRALVWMLDGILNLALEPDYGPEPTGQVRHSRADICAARTGLGWRPTVDVEEGLRRTVAWFREVGCGAT